MFSEKLLNSRVKINSELLRQELQGESVILDITSGQYFGLNNDANVMWDALTSSDTIGDALLKLGNHFEVDADRLESDLLRLVVELDEHSLIDVCEG